MTPYFYLTLSIVFNAFAQVLLKRGVNSFSYVLSEQGSLAFGLQLLKTSAVWGGVFLYGMSLVVYLFALSKLQVSVAAPLLSLSYLVVVFLSLFFLSEPLTWEKFLGVILIIAGVYFVTKS